MDETAAQHSAKRFPDFLIGGIGFIVEDRLRGQDDAAKAKPALRCPFFDKGLLKWVGLLGCAESLQSCDFIFSNRTDRQNTGTDSVTAKQNGAGSALRHSAAKLRATQPEVVA